MALGHDYERKQEVTRHAPLTTELANVQSPVRHFLDSRFTHGLRTVQRWYREDAPDLVVPAADLNEVSPGTIGTAADWLMRFLLYPAPSLRLPVAGARLFAPRTRMLTALSEIAESLALGREMLHHPDDCGFTGPVSGSNAEPEYLARTCWVFSLFTEVFRRGPEATALGPLSRFSGQQVMAGQLLDLAPPAALDQLAAFRHVFQKMLIPRLAVRPGRWYIGPEFIGSRLLHADADLIAAGLLIDLKTSAKRPALARDELFQVIGYALLDFEDAYQITDLGIFSARNAYLASWDLQTLLQELAGQVVSLPDTRNEFRQLLLSRVA
jgi:hypothetical protein